jgi:lipoprotein-anchoring transpeptidase ErfK/SrfK
MASLAGTRRMAADRAAIARFGPIAVIAAAVTVVAGCGSGVQSTVQGRSGHQAGGPVAAPVIKITPATGTRNVRPDRPIRVLAVGGRIVTVAVRTGGRTVAGQFNSQGTEWRSQWALAPGAGYVVQATAKNATGKTVTGTSSFRTLQPANTVSAWLDWTLAANQGRYYGVGLPIILDFSQPVTRKAAVVRALVVQAQDPVPGAWRWITDQQVVYRAEGFWPAHQTVTLHAHLAGVRVAAGVYGTKNLTYRFRIGVARISTVNVRTHHMTVRIDGKVARSYGISAGVGTSLVYTTPSGTALTMDKNLIVIMTNPNVPKGAPGWYREPVPLAVRLTNSGIYLHETPGAEWCLGVTNCSHGCIRQPPAEALWFYNTNQTADVVHVYGTNRKMAFGDGWTFYQMPWKQWAKGAVINYAGYSPYVAYPAGPVAGLRLRIRP